MILQDLIDTLKATLDAFVANSIAPMYAAMLPAASVITMLMIIGFGIALIAGARADGPAITKSGSIIVLANAMLHVPYYLTEYIILPLQSFMEGTSALLVSTAGGTAGTAGLVGTYEEFLWEFMELCGIIFEEVGLFDGIAPFLLLVILIIPYVIMIGVIVMYLFEVYTVFALWQVLGPIFILCFMWRPTRGISVSSLRWLLHACFTVILLSAVASIVVFMVNDTLTKMPISGGQFTGDAGDWFASKQFIIICIYGYISLLLMTKAASWASMLVQFFDGGGLVSAAVSGGLAAVSKALSNSPLIKDTRAEGGGKNPPEGGGNTEKQSTPTIPLPPSHPPGGYTASTLMKTQVDK